MAPPTIQVTRVNGASPSHSNMIISPPRINLRRAASYNNNSNNSSSSNNNNSNSNSNSNSYSYSHADRGPLSSTSSRFGFDHLAFTSSPPPSPGLPLPQQAPRMRKKTSAAPRPSRVFRLVLWLAGTVVILYLATQSIRQGQVVPAIGWTRASDEDYEMVGQDDLPDFPTPIVVTDRRGRARWTVSIPPSYEFPLTVREYGDVCAKCKEVSSRVSKLHSHSPAALNQISLIGGEPGVDRNFLDVKEAEEQGYLPGAAGAAVKEAGDPLGVDGNSLADKAPACATSLTYVLESDDAGLGKTLMTLWMAYGLARREGRAFFVDDRRWAYGEYAGMFEAPPDPGCRPPAQHEMVPCPRQARHLVVSAANAREVFGGDVPEGDAYAEGEAAGLERRPAQGGLYGLAREGYKALFRPGRPDREYVFNRVIEHRVKTYAVEGEAHNGRVVGIHVRHGDRHPLEFQYADSYIPLSSYVDAAHAALNDSLGHAGHDGIARDKSFFVLASDDPLVYGAAETGGAVRAQAQIRLAGKEDVDPLGLGPGGSHPDKSVMHKFVDETFGWEGGFFAAMFWNLGLSAQSAAANTAAGRVPDPSPETIRLRSLVGRAYVMDLAVLADLSSGGVVCAVSAMGCRLLAVMMGPERAFGKGEWRNVDGGFGWTGVTWA